MTEGLSGKFEMSKPLYWTAKVEDDGSIRILNPNQQFRARIDQETVLGLPEESALDIMTLGGREATVPVGAVLAAREIALRLLAAEHIG